MLLFIHCWNEFLCIIGARFYTLSEHIYIHYFCVFTSKPGGVVYYLYIQLTHFWVAILDTWWNLKILMALWTLIFFFLLVLLCVYVSCLLQVSNYKSTDSTLSVVISSYVQCILMYLHHFGAFQIKDCMTRYNGDTDQQRRKKFSFPARLLCIDCYEVKERKMLVGYPWLTWWFAFLHMQTH